MLGFMLPAHSPLNRLCQRRDGDARTPADLTASRARAGAGPVRFTCAQLLLQASQDLAIKACLLQSTLQAVVFGVLNYSSWRGLHPSHPPPCPDSLCGNRWETLLLGSSPCGSVRVHGRDFHVLFLCRRTSVLSCSVLCCHRAPVAEVNGSCSVLPFCTGKSEN